MDMMPGMWGMGGMMIAAALFWLLVLIALGATAWAVWKHRPKAHDDRALAILRDRYARGEISREEFEERRRDLAA